MHLVQEIMKAGGAIAKGKALTEVKDQEVTVKDMKTNEITNIPAETTVLAMGVRADREVYTELKEAYGDCLILVGDACKPGQIYDALHSGYDRAFVYSA